MEAISSKKNFPFLKGGGEMGELTHKYNWAATSIGAPDQWPQSLRTTISILLNSRFPMFLFWGPDLICFYNDAYRPSLGNNGKHPWALGKKGTEVWPEIWPDIKPLIDQVLAGGDATWSEDQLLPIYRNGKLEDVYWTFSYSPVSDETGQPAGVFVTCTETTATVLNFQKLKLSDQRFQNLVSEANLGIIILSGQELKVEVVNDAYGQLIGRTAAELLNKPLFSIIPEAEKVFRPLLENVIHTGENLYLYEQPYLVYVDGQKKEGYLNIIYQPYKELDGTISGVLVLCSDITGSITARKKVEESELFARSIFKNSVSAQAVWLGEEMTLSIANERMLEIWGRDESVIGKSFLEVMPELKESGVMETMRYVLHTGKPFHQPEEKVDMIRYGKRYTGYYSYTFQPLATTEGKNYGIICTTTEITEQVLNRKKIEEADEKVQLAIESADLGTYEINLFTDEMKTSDRFNVIWGIDKTPVRSRLADQIHPEDRPIREEAHRQSVATGNLHYEVRLLINHNEIKWIRVKGKVLYNSAGKPSTLIGVIQDITEQKLFAEELTRQVQMRTEELSVINEQLKVINEDFANANEQLQRANAELEQFTYAASHDMQEPLRKVHTFSTFLLDNNAAQLDERGKAYLTKIGTSVQRMKNIIDDLLNYSHQSNEAIYFEKVDLNKIIADIEQDMELLIVQKKAIIKKAPLPNIQAVSTQMNQLFFNLFSNALKFSKIDEPVRISIESEILSAKEVNLYKELNNAKEYVKICFSDNGIGFDQQHAEQIFSLFKRLHAKAEYEGTGIGLGLCKKIVQNHHGIIWAEGMATKGATFYILLPVSNRNL